MATEATGRPANNMSKTRSKDRAKAPPSKGKANFAKNPQQSGNKNQNISNRAG